MPVNKADVNWAIAAINRAIDNSAPGTALLAVLQNETAKIANVKAQDIDKYKMILEAEKRQRSKTQQTNDNVDLNHDEIQKLIDDMNCLLALQVIENLVKSRDIDGLVDSLQLLQLDVNLPTTDKAKDVMFNQLNAKLQNPDTFLHLQDVEAAINAASTYKAATDLRENADTETVVREINLALEADDVSVLLSLLRYVTWNSLVRPWDLITSFAASVKDSYFCMLIF